MRYQFTAAHFVTPWTLR